jgi:hypothetical protein
MTPLSYSLGKLLEKISRRMLDSQQEWRAPGGQNCSVGG